MGGYVLLAASMCSLLAPSDDKPRFKPSVTPSAADQRQSPPSSSDNGQSLLSVAVPSPEVEMESFVPSSAVTLSRVNSGASSGTARGDHEPSHEQQEAPSRLIRQITGETFCPHACAS